MTGERSKDLHARPKGRWITFLFAHIYSFVSLDFHAQSTIYCVALCSVNLYFIDPNCAMGASLPPAAKDAPMTNGRHQMDLTKCKGMKLLALGGACDHAHRLLVAVQGPRLLLYGPPSPHSCALFSHLLVLEFAKCYFNCPAVGRPLESTTALPLVTAQ